MTEKKRSVSTSAKLTLASLLMAALALLAGGAGLWQLLAVGRTYTEARQEEQRRALSLELLAASHELVASLDALVLTRDLEVASTDLATALGAVKFYFESLQSSAEQTGASTVVGDIETSYNDLRAVVREVDLLARQSRWTEAAAVLQETARPATEQLDALIRQLAREADQNVAAADLRVQEATPRAIVLVAAVVAFTVIVALVWQQFVFRALGRSIASLRQGVGRIGGGDLAYRVAVRTNDEVGDLAREFNRMAERLTELVGDMEGRLAAEQAAVAQYVGHMDMVARGILSARLSLQYEWGEDDPLLVLGKSLNEMTAGLQRTVSQTRDAAGGLSAAAAQILAATTQQAAGASEQSAAITQATTTIEQVRAIAEQTADSARGVAELAQHTAAVSRTGERAVGDTINGMAEIRQQVESIAQNVVALSGQTHAVAEIIAATHEIATQSKMLALNAAVEAARAGEAGRGFAVVAGEVRTLAERSRAATARVQEILAEIQRGVAAAVQATEEGVRGTQVGVKLAGEAGLAIQHLADSVANSAAAAAQIAAAAGQQMTGVEQIGLAMQNINQVTVQTVASAHQTERIAGDLNALAGQLRQLVEQYG